MCNFSEQELTSLREGIKNILSEKRFLHTLGVENVAERLGNRLLPGRINELRAAALLHDVAKELDTRSLLNLVKDCSFELSAEDMKTEQAYHSFAAPAFILEHFNRFATKSILSAVFYHTLGSPEMSIFDEIIFVSDYIEDGRAYNACKTVRDSLYSELEAANNKESAIKALHKAVVSSINYTVKSLALRNVAVNSRTVMTKDAFQALI